MADMERWIKPGFAVIGLEGSTAEEPDVVKRLWAEANRRFGEVAHLAARTPEGALVGVWGAMSDASRAFRPWEEDFRVGLYLAGVECRADAQPPAGWTRWDVPGFEYVRVPADAPDVFRSTLAALAAQGLSLAGAVQDFTDPATGQGSMCFPIRRLEHE